MGLQCMYHIYTVGPPSDTPSDTPANHPQETHRTPTSIFQNSLLLSPYNLCLSKDQGISVAIKFLLRIREYFHEFPKILGIFINEYNSRG